MVHEPEAEIEPETEQIVSDAPVSGIEEHEKKRR